MSLSQEDLEIYQEYTEELTGLLRGDPGLQHVRDGMESRGYSPSSCYLCVYREDGDGGAQGLLVAGDGAVVSFELRRRTWLSWMEHSDLDGLANEFSGTEYVFELSKELREAATEPGGLGGAARRIAPAEVVPRKLTRGKKPPRKKRAVKKVAAGKAAAKKAPTKGAPTKKAPAKKSPAR